MNKEQLDALVKWVDANIDVRVASDKGFLSAPHVLILNKAYEHMHDAFVGDGGSVTQTHDETTIEIDSELLTPFYRAVDVFIRDPVNSVEQIYDEIDGDDIASARYAIRNLLKIFDRMDEVKNPLILHITVDEWQHIVTARAILRALEEKSHG